MSESHGSRVAGVDLYMMNVVVVASVSQAAHLLVMFTHNRFKAAQSEREEKKKHFASSIVWKEGVFLMSEVKGQNWLAG